jgi:ArsR family transcriptional regulator, arsenate/arsenite/antimonite-responsive transcriptional repressor / arsenate reductase (thioredoxin)
VPNLRLRPQPALFLCTRNSARSQLAAALWRHLAAAPADSAGTHPARRVHPGAVRAARRAGLGTLATSPQHLDAVTSRPELVVTVCDQAHEELGTGRTWLHWSVPDPVTTPTAAAFNATVAELRSRIGSLLGETA